MLIVISTEARETFVGHQVWIQLNDDGTLILIYFQSKSIGEVQIEHIPVLTSNGQTRRIASHVVQLCSGDFQCFPSYNDGQFLEWIEKRVQTLRVSMEYLLTSLVQSGTMEKFNVDLPCG